MIASSICTARIGCAPAAVSPDSMIASALCATAVAASLTSARVGRDSVRIDSSTCVASTVGTPRSRARRSTSRCTRGTRCSGISRPRSPRATITPSATARISSSLSIASGRSSLAMIGTSGRPSRAVIARAATMSAADWTKLSAMTSTPSARPKARSRASFSVTPEAGSGTPGALMPLCSPSSLPKITVVVISRSVADSTRSSTCPSSSSRRSPAPTALASG